MFDSFLKFYKENVVGSWKTTAAGAFIMVCCVYMVLATETTITEASIPMVIGLLIFIAREPKKGDIVEEEDSE
jgi:hypothetical protein